MMAEGIELETNQQQLLFRATLSEEEIISNELALPENDPDGCGVLSRLLVTD